MSTLINPGGSTGPHQRRTPGAVKRTSALALATTIAFSGLGAVAIQGIQGITSAPAAHADEPGTRLHGVVVQAPPAGAFGDWGMWLGSTLVPNTNGTGYCFEMGEDAGFTPGVEGTAAIDWLNVAIADNQANVSTHPALSYLVHEAADPRFNTPWNGQGKPYPNLRDSTDPQLVAIRAQAAQIKAAAQAKAGPYTGTAALTMSDNVHGTVQGVSVLSSTGNPVTGVRLTATLTNAVWDGFGTSTVTIASGESLPGFTATGSGIVNVRFDGVGPAGTVTTYVIDGGQDVLTGGNTAPFSFRSADVQATVAFQPTATSTAGQYVEAGQALTDVLHVATSTGVANDWIFNNGANVPARFDVDWYYSPVALPASANVPASAVKFASGTGTATGPGDVTVTADKKADKDGHYYPVARFSKAAQPAELQQFFTGDWSAGFNDPGEHTIQKYTPQVTTKASVIEDGKVYDVITVTGNEPGRELTVTSDLTLTSEKSVEGGTDQAPADAKIVGTVTTKVTGNGEFKTPAVNVPWETIVKEKWDADKPANLYFSEKIVATETTKAWDGKELLPNETVPVEKPSIKTKASANITVGEKAHDTGVVSGTVPSGDGITVTTKVDQFKADDSTDGSAQAVCINPSWTSPVQSVTTAGEIVYPEHVIEHKGTYMYVEELNLTIDKGPGQEPFKAQLHKGKCGEKNETVIVFPKEVPPTPEKPQLHTPDQPAPVAPVAYTGEVTAHQGMNDVFVNGGISALVLAAFGLTMALILKRKAEKEKKATAAFGAGEGNTSADELV